MTTDEFKKAVQELYKQMDPTNQEVLLMVTSFDANNKPCDVNIMVTGCLVCHYETLELYIEQEGIEHKTNAATKVH